MTAVLNSASNGAAEGAGTPISGAFPVAQLLPDSVSNAKRVRKVRSLALAGIGIAVIAVGGLYFMSSSQAGQMQQQLDDAQSTAAVLSAQQAKYADVPRVAAQVASAQDDIATALGDEVLWSGVLRQLAATTPPGVTLTKITIAPADPRAATTNGAATAGNVQLGATATSFPLVATWLDTLSAQKNFVNPSLSHAVVDLNSASHFVTVDGSFDLAASAVSGRYRKATP